MLPTSQASKPLQVSLIDLLSSSDNDEVYESRSICSESRSRDNDSDSGDDSFIADSDEDISIESDFLAQPRQLGIH